MSTGHSPHKRSCNGIWLAHTNSPARDLTEHSGIHQRMKRGTIKRPAAALIPTASE